ncbi:hypothetical protein NEOKW01_2033 [Nematocida sp. AWRm80]|nr:hypothetical protein NEOKW01_2033 [Nematocida sp. AWRm80]
MEWTPSVICDNEEYPNKRSSKKISLETTPKEHTLSKIASIEKIYAGSTPERKVLIRPVLLEIQYKNELVFPENISNFNEQEYFSQDKIWPVPIGMIKVFPSELTTAIKESIRVEKKLAHKWETNEPVPKSTNYITNTARTYFISKHRLLGEILKTQRKIERTTLTGTLSAQKALEAFLYKLCTLKVLSDRAFSE